MFAKPHASDFPAVGSYRAHVALSEGLTDAYATSYALLSAWGDKVRRAYRLEADGRVCALSWRTLTVVAAADERADALAHKLDRMAEACGAVRSGFAGKSLAESNLAQGGIIAQALDKLALACHDRDTAAFATALSDISAQSYALERMTDGYRKGKARWQEACEKSERDANALAERAAD